MLDLFMGDPVYDEQKNIIRRDFGIKNIVAIMIVGFIGYSLMGEMGYSGKRKMKGGSGWWSWARPDDGWRRAVIDPTWDLITHGAGYPGRKEYWGLGILLSPSRMIKSCGNGEFCPLVVGLAFTGLVGFSFFYAVYYFRHGGGHESTAKKIKNNAIVKWVGTKAHTASQNKAVQVTGVVVLVLLLSASFWAAVAAGGAAGGGLWVIVCLVAILIKKV